MPPQQCMQPRDEEREESWALFRKMPEFFAPECDADDALRTAAVAFAFHCAVGLLSRLSMPVLFPVTAKKLDAQAGMRSYWDSSVASTVVGVINPMLAVSAIYSRPEFFTSPDGAPFMATSESCRCTVLFLTWTVWETLFQLYNWGKWPGGQAMLVHHISAITAWCLYLSGGYGHAIGLVGMCCEATNPFMNLRWLLSELGLKDHVSYTVNGLLFLLSWVAVRILFALPVGLYLIYTQWPALAQALPAWRLVLYVGFFGVGGCLNCMWGAKLLAGALKMLAPKKKE